ncbi:hypothetical protein ES703_01131 [subsurface metagenome]
MKTDKKGFLLAEETLKIILAVIAIGFLAFLLFSLYNANKTAKDLELAKESLDFLIQEINAQRAEVEIYNPKGWIILSWPYGDTREVPLSCSNLAWSNCICIAKDVSLAGKAISNLPWTDDLLERLRKKSDDGACRNNPEGFSISEPIKIKDPPITLSIENKIISKK